MNRNPEVDLTIVKSEQMNEIFAKLNNIEKNLDLLLDMLKNHIETTYSAQDKK